MRPSPWCDRVPSATRMSSATLPGTGDVQKAHMETTQITTRRSLTWLHFGWLPSQSTADSPAENLSEPSHGCHVSYSMRTVAHRSILAQGMLSQLWAGRRVETYPCPGLAEAQGLPTSRVPEGKMAASTPNIDDFRSFVGRFWGTFGHRRQWHGGFMGGSWSAMTTGKRAQIRKLWCTCLTATDLP